MEKRTVNISLNEKQALVLFEWLASLDESSAAPSSDTAERSVLWTIEGQLEKQLTAVVAPDYQEQVAKARESVLIGS